MIFNENRIDYFHFQLRKFFKALANIIIDFLLQFKLLKYNNIFYFIFLFHFMAIYVYSNCKLYFRKRPRMKKYIYNQVLTKLFSY